MSLRLRQKIHTDAGDRHRRSVVDRAVVDQADIDQALKTLGEHRGSIGRRYSDLKNNFKKFKQDASLFRTTLEDRSKQIREVLCNDEEWESKVLK